MPGVASTEISFVRDIAAAGFIAGTVPTKSTPGHRARNCGNAKVEAVLQAITTMSGSMLADLRRHDGEDARGQLRLAPGAIGKPRVIGAIDELRVRADFRDFRKNGEPAKA